MMRTERSMRHTFTSDPASRCSPPTMGESMLASAWRNFVNPLFDPYRPERHYMRGPGPKWRAKHGFTEWP
jgi:hypothetical protein